MSCFAPVAPKMITSNSSAFMTPIAMARWKRVDLCPSERCEKGNVDERSIEIGRTGIHQGEAKKLSDAIDATDSGERVIFF